MATFTVDWESWFMFMRHGAIWEELDPMVDEPTEYLLDLLSRHNIKAIFYVVGWLKNRCPLLYSKIVNAGHVIGDHTYYHEAYVNEVKESELYRPPRWKGTSRMFGGGFWFRFMPYWWLKQEVERSGIFFIHPHDIMDSHPRCSNPLRNWMRQYGLKTSRDKLERLCREVKWDEPRA